MKNKKILIVDDQKEVIRMIASQLMTEEITIEVITAINGQIACQVARRIT